AECVGHYLARAKENNPLDVGCSHRNSHAPRSGPARPTRADHVANELCVVFPNAALHGDCQPLPRFWSLNMKAVWLVVKMFLLWTILPLTLGVVLVILPCYTLGELGWERTWCGYKSEPPHTQAQFLAGLGLGLAIAVTFTVKVIRKRS